MLRSPESVEKSSILCYLFLTILTLPEGSELRSFCTIGEWNIVEILDFPREYGEKRKVLYKK